MAQNQVERLQEMLRRVDWNSEESRHGFLREFDSSIASFNQIHSHESIFQSGEIDRLLIDCIVCPYSDSNAQDARKRFIQFVIGIGYEDEAEIQGGAQTIQRTTAIHHTAIFEDDDLVEQLFKIYCNFHANYSDESGLTHLHVASMAGCHSVVRNFCTFGHDVNLVWRETGDTPLHLALDRDQDMVAALLIVRVADPMIPNSQGVEAMELIVARNYQDPLVQYLFSCSKEHVWKWTRAALEFMARFELSLKSCDIVLQNLTDEDWWNICVATDSLAKEFYNRLDEHGIEY